MVQVQKNIRNMGVVAACIVLLVVGIAAAILAERFAPISYSTQVRIESGPLRGRERNTPSGKAYLSFQGIPYAKPPVGKLRFKFRVRYPLHTVAAAGWALAVPDNVQYDDPNFQNAPQPVEPWSEVRDVLSEGNICPQPHKVSKNSPIKSMGNMLRMVLSMPGLTKFMINYIMRMKEDCLYLNVYTPQVSLPADRLKPVVVFIHGGGFISGNGDMSLYGPDYLIDEDLVVVTFNYRLGVFGFLSTNSSAAPGNAGLKDQVQAMRWVRDNIRAFGGDPDSITVYGESAGSASVHFHLLSPMSKGLFHRAILASSTTQDWYTMTEHQDRYSRDLALECGADNDTADDPEMRVAFLAKLPHSQINDKLVNVLTDEDMRSIIGCVPFVPVVEPEIPGEEAFLLEHPNHLIRDGRFAQVPMIIGSNSKEGSLFYTGVTRPPNEEGLLMIDENMTSTIPDAVFYRLDPDKRLELSGKVRQFYFHGGHVNNETMNLLIDLFGDLSLMHGIHVSTQWHAHYSTAQNPLYVYHFTVGSKAGLSFFFSTRNLKGAGHGEDLSYIFRHHLFKNDPRIKQSDREQQVRTNMTKLFANFIRNGNPTPNEDLHVTWPAANPRAMQYLEIGEQLVVKKDLLRDRMDFWDRIFRDVVGDPVYDYLPPLA